MTEKLVIIAWLNFESVNGLSLPLKENCYQIMWSSHIRVGEYQLYKMTCITECHQLHHSAQEAGN